MGLGGEKDLGDREDVVDAVDEGIVLEGLLSESLASDEIVRCEEALGDGEVARRLRAVAGAGVHG